MGNNGQHDVRSTSFSVVDRIVGLEYSAVPPQRFTRVRVDIESWKIAAGNIDANPMPLLEDIRGAKRFDGKLVDGARLHQLLLFRPIAVSGPDNSVGQIHVKTCGKIDAGGIDVDQLCREVGVRASGRCVDDNHNRSHDFDATRQRFRLANDHIMTGLQWQVGWPGTIESGRGVTFEFSLSLIKCAADPEWFRGGHRSAVRQ